MKKLFISLLIFTPLFTLAVVLADLGVATCGLKDTYNNCLDSKYKIGGEPTLKVTAPPTFQNGVNLVQVTAPSYYLIEGEMR